MLAPFSRWLGVLLVLLGSFTLSACSGVLYGGINAASSRKDVIEHRNEVFDPAHGLALDVYQPRGAVDAPVAVFFYGGTWKHGARANFRWLGRALARQGVVAVVADYRKFPQVGLDGFMTDAAKATAWSYRNAHIYGGSSQRVAVMGHSAGAHLAVLLGSDSRWLSSQGMKPRQLCGVVGLAGPYVFLPLTDPDLIEVFGKTAAAAEPISHVGGDEPPMLLLHGANDKIVPPQDSVALQAALQRADGTGVVELYPDMGHMRLLLSLDRSAADSQVLRDTTAFLRQCRAP